MTLSVLIVALLLLAYSCLATPPDFKVDEVPSGSRPELVKQVRPKLHSHAVAFHKCIVDEGKNNLYSCWWNTMRESESVMKLVTHFAFLVEDEFKIHLTDIPDNAFGCFSFAFWCTAHQYANEWVQGNATSKVKCSVQTALDDLEIISESLPSIEDSEILKKCLEDWRDWTVSSEVTACHRMRFMESGRDDFYYHLSKGNIDLTQATPVYPPRIEPEKSSTQENASVPTPKKAEL